MDLAGWVDPDRAYWSHRPRAGADWDALVDEYGGRRPGPLRQALRVAAESGCRTVVVENRYVDADYRSEYSAFWSSRFQPPPGFARRVHFFTADLTDDQLHALPSDSGYLGYLNLRPVEDGPVGRALLQPPPSITGHGAVLTTVEDEISFFGNDLTVRGVPFCQQDREFLRCAHAACWVLAYAAYRRRLIGRQHTSQIVRLSPSHLSFDRPLPSGGMNYHQMQAVFGQMGLPALMYFFGGLPTVQGIPNPTPVPNQKPGEWDVRLFSVICRYLNSGFPVLVTTKTHAFVVVGWYRENGLIRFIASDDEIGPYDVIENPLSDPIRGPWEGMMVPLPPRVLMTGEAAENDAYETLYSLGFSTTVPSQWIDLGKRLIAGEISRRTTLVRGRDWKAHLAEQGRSDPSVEALRLARASHWVWVVEAHDRAARDAGDPCVLAEFVYDATSYDKRPTRLAVSYPGATVVVPPAQGARVAVAGTRGSRRFPSGSATATRPYIGPPTRDPNADPG
jgi:hypothetical protein